MTHESHSQIRRVPHTFLCEPMGRSEIFNTVLLLVEIEGHFTHEFVTYVRETQDWRQCLLKYNMSAVRYLGLVGLVLTDSYRSIAEG
jgi:hypothetical protein